ncbi:MAG TPA: DUF3592 domain-containing protein [Thermoanaerobaculia bacterium]|jgi:uncharacterized repeat protein (TIGR01451 family)|nr:DUF3592 domain-containing protein [Thermoanaerobaculia bacterium]
MTVLLVVALGAKAEPPKFDTSTITASRATIHPLETIDYTITIRNSGGSTPSYLRVANAIPTSAMFVRASPDWKFIEADRELSWMGTLPPGASKVLTLTVVTRPESSGLTLANRAAIHYDGSYRGIDHDLQITTPPSTSKAGPIVFGYLAAAGILYLVFRRRASPLRNTAIALILLSIGFLIFFIDRGRRDARVQARYAETQCTVLDSMARYAESQNASSTGSRRSSGTWTPIFALSYPTHEGETVSIGYASASRLQFGGSKPTEAALASLPRGGVAPCWYDPEDPKQIVLVRGIGGAYAFAAIPLMTLILGLTLLRRSLH